MVGVKDKNLQVYLSPDTINKLIIEAKTNDQ